MIKNFSIALLIIIINSGRFYPQFSYIKLERFNVNNGLSNTSINCITQSSDGYLWIATKDGLNRYDGQSFKIFKNNPAEPNSLPENYIMYLFESSDKVLWVGTWGSGLCKYDPVQESFIKINKPGNNLYIQYIFEDHLGNIWFGTTTNGLNKLNPNSLNIVTYNTGTKNEFYFPHNNITTIAEDANYNLWVGTWGGGLIKFSPEKNQILQVINTTNNPNSISNDHIWFIAAYDNDSFLISTDAGINLFNATKNTFSQLKDIPDEYKTLLSTSIRQTLVDYKNRLWIGSYNYSGLFLLEDNRKGKTGFTHLSNDESNSNSLV